MAVDDGIKIAVELLVSVALITLTIVGVRATTRGVSQSARNVVALGRDADVKSIGSVNNKTVNGETAITFLDQFADSAPILLVTSELYNSNPNKCSYDVSQMHNTLAQEYVNPSAYYRIEVAQDAQEETVLSIRVIQSDLLGLRDLPQVNQQDMAYQDAVTHLDLKKDLVEIQYKLYKNGY